MRVRLHGQPATEPLYRTRGLLRVGGAAAGGGARLSAGGRGGAAARLRAASDGAGIHTRYVDTMI